ncbi:hypothetical protein M422DRAFT_225013 [Sphaerobolus stellatus SS14]|nr:hypothetical protein M422DRAFT_225013 [Sphaerobolus stellatus SS14]
MPTFGIQPSYSDYSLMDASKDIPGLRGLQQLPSPTFSEPSPIEEPSPDSHEEAEEDYEEEFDQTQTQSQSQSEQYEPSMNLSGVIGVMRDMGTNVEYPMFQHHSEWTIGRDRSNFIFINHAKISTIHCRITWNGKLDNECELSLMDCSKNGTFLNGVRIHSTKGNTTAILRSGDMLELGGFVTFHFRDVNSIRVRDNGNMREVYDMGKEIGNGAFARVYKCIKRSDGTQYAVKVLIKEKIRRMNSQGGIEREIEILRRLRDYKHDYIVCLEEHIEEDDHIYLVMELIEGGDMLSFIINNPYFPENEVRRMAAQICEAVAYLHSRGIIHRDLKPENIMLTKTKPPNCKIADFGLSKIVEGDTFMKTMCGTPAYLAPEVMVRSNTHHTPYDNKVDSYSLGVIFFCMLSGCLPFGEFKQEWTHEQRIAFFRNRRADWKALSSRGPVSDEARDFIQKLLIEEPRDRMSVANALDHVWLRDVVPLHARGTYAQSSYPSSDLDFPVEGLDPQDVPCSQGMQDLNLSDMPIPGLGAAAEADRSEFSVTAQIPGAFPKGPKPHPQLAAIEEDRRAYLKRKSEAIMGSSPLSSLSSLPSDDEDEAPPPPRPTSTRKPRAGTPARPSTARAKKTPASSARKPATRTPASSAKKAAADVSTPATRRSARGQPAAKVPRIS